VVTGLKTHIMLPNISKDALTAISSLLEDHTENQAYVQEYGAAETLVQVMEMYHDDLDTMQRALGCIHLLVVANSSGKLLFRSNDGCVCVAKLLTQYASKAVELPVSLLLTSAKCLMELSTDVLCAQEIRSNSIMCYVAFAMKTLSKISTSWEDLSDIEEEPLHVIECVLESLFRLCQNVTQFTAFGEDARWVIDVIQSSVQFSKNGISLDDECVQQLSAIFNIIISLDKFKPDLDDKENPKDSKMICYMVLRNWIQLLLAYPNKIPLLSTLSNLLNVCFVIKDDRYNMFMKEYPSISTMLASISENN
jgi:hypothetical protein